jgi:endonuclease G
MKKALILFLLFPFIVFSQQDLKYYEKYMPTTSCEKQNLIHYNYYSSSFCDEYQLSEWVIYLLPGDRLYKRDDTPLKYGFEMPPRHIYGNIYSKTSRTNIPLYYKKNDYDQGHLVPVADMRFDKIAMSEVRFFTNAIPQHKSINRGVMRQLEREMRKWSYKKQAELGDLVLISGWSTQQISNYLKPDGTISSEAGIDEFYLPIPKYMYKIFVDIQNERSIAFLFENDTPKEKQLSDYNIDIDDLPEIKLSDYVISIDSLQNLTGLDFFYKLSNEISFELDTGNKK